MFEINDQLSISEEYLRYQYARSSGPGGQHVNKVNTQVQLFFDVKQCPELSESIKRRLIELAGHRYSDKGIIVVRCDESRSQSANRQECLNRLRVLILAALKPPKKRKPTRPSLASRQRRLESKSHRGKIKQMRGKISNE